VCGGVWWHVVVAVAGGGGGRVGASLITQNTKHKTQNTAAEEVEELSS
jgi:hypothetical protein